MKSARASERPGRAGALSPLVLLALAAGLLGALSAAVGSASLDARPPSALGPAPPSTLTYEVPCPPGQLPDDGVCIPVPSASEVLRPEGPGSPEALLPLRGDRPADFSRYQLPLDAEQAPRVDVQDAAPSAGPGTVRLLAGSGASVLATRLEGQTGPTKVVFASHGPPALVITAHDIQRERGLLTHLLVLSELVELEEALLDAMPTAPLPLEDGAPLGRMGSAGLLLSLRQVRRDVKLPDAVPDLAPEAVFAVDARNLLPLSR